MCVCVCVCVGGCGCGEGASIGPSFQGKGSGPSFQGKGSGAKVLRVLDRTVTPTFSTLCRRLPLMPSASRSCRHFL